jgi:two-component system sensor histidine kinase PilS (NtrC family)
VTVFSPDVARYSLSAAFPIHILDALSAAVVVTDPQGAIVYANSRAHDLLGLFGPELAGRHIGEVIPETVLAIGVPPPSDSEDASRFRCSYRRPDGRKLLLGFSASAFESPTDCTAVPVQSYLLFMFQDIGAFEALAEERNRLLLLAAVGDTMPSILHELKNPLAAITTAVEVLIEDVPTGEVQSQLHAILGEVRRMRLNLDGIGLAHGDVRSNHYEAIDFALLEVMRVLEFQMQSKRILGVTDVATMPLLPFAAGVIRAIAFNLVNNAIHACRPDDVVTLRARLGEGSELIIEVIDTGAGMPPEVLAKCQDLFYTTKSNGSGIGLALCRMVAEKAGGRLTIESEPKKGTIVRVSLPVKHPAGKEK